MTTIAPFSAFVRRDFAIARSYRLQFVLEAGSVMFQLAMFFFLGRVVDDANPNIGGTEQGYFAYVVFGLALLGWLTSALTSFASTLRVEQTTGSLEALLATPPSPTTLIVGTSAYAFISATITALLYIVLAVGFFGLRFTPHIGAIAVAIYALIASLVLFSAFGMILAAATLVYKRTGALIGLATGGLAILGGVYFPLSVLPTPLRTIAELLPFTWALEVLRSALLAGEIDWGRMALLGASNVALIPVAIWALERALQLARRAGSLGQY